MARRAVQASRRINRLRFGPHDRVTLGGRAYCRPKETPNGWAFGRDDAPELTQELTHETIEAFTHRPGYRYERDYYAPAVSRQRSAGLAQSMDDVPRHKQPEILFRYQICHRFHRLCGEGVVTRSERGIIKALPIIAAEVALLECGKVRPTLRRPSKPTPASPEASSISGTKRRGGRQRGVPTSGKPEVSLRKMPPVPTFWKWWKKYIGSGRVPWGLRDNYGNCGAAPRPICPEAHAVLEQMGVDYGSREQPSKALLLERMRNRITALNEGRADDVKIACPSRKQLNDHLDSLRNIRVVAGRKGGDAARRDNSPVSQGMGIVLPLERVEMDHWEVHLQSILVGVGLWDRLNRNMRRRIGRMHLCVAIDVATKVILGMHLSETPTSADAVAVVQAIVSDKGKFADAVGAALPWDMHGTPELIATDGGTAFTADDFGLAVASLGCDHIIPPGGVPSLRGTMERFFKTVHMRLISRFHGRTFENMLACGDYPAEKLANLDTRDLAWVIVRWVVDVYHATGHEGLGGATPRNAWLEAVELYGTTAPPDPHVRRSIFGIPLVRILNKEGIRILGVRYWSDALVEEFFQRGIVEIEIKLDPTDIGEISVRIGSDWHAAQCIRRDVAGIDVETWIEAATEMRRVRGEQADFNANVVRNAVEAIEAVGRGAADREGIANPTPTSDQIDHVERTALLGFSIPDPIAEAAAEDLDDLLAGGIPVTGTVGPPQAPVEPKTARARHPPEPMREEPDDTDDTTFDFED